MLLNNYNGKKVLVTGNTGFKGAWLTTWLLELGAEVYGISSGVPTDPSHFEIAGLQNRMCFFTTDILNFDKLAGIISQIRPNFIFHLAAQAIVRHSYQNPLETLKTNIIGTAHILEILRRANFPCNAIIVTSDKCYDNVEWVWGYRENDPLGGKDPYSASKAGAEMVIRTYAESFFQKSDYPVKVVSTRAGNVIGGGDWAIDRIVPDCIRAWARKEVVEIRSPDATRPWQHVLEPLSGYLCLGARLAESPSLNGESFNFGPPASQNFSVRMLIEEMARHWDRVAWKDVSENARHVYESDLLKLCCDKALHELSWKPALNFRETVELTVDWYKHFYNRPDENIFEKTLEQIEFYTAEAARKEISWAAL